METTSRTTVSFQGVLYLLALVALLRSIEAQQCQAPKIRLATNSTTTLKVGVLAIRGIDTAINDFTALYVDYLTGALASRFESHISFEIVPVAPGDALERFTPEHIDFVFANPTIYSCIESEQDARSLATIRNQRKVNGETFELEQFGGVIIARQNSTVEGIPDIRGKRVGLVSITGLGSGQMQFRELLRHGVHHLQDPSQILFTKNQAKVVNLVLDGSIDVGFVRTDQLERTIDQRTGQLVDIRGIKIVGQVPPDDFPFPRSTVLYPEWNFASLPHVPDEIVVEIQEALLSIGRYASVAEQIAECLKTLCLNTTNHLSLYLCTESCLKEHPSCDDGLASLALTALRQARFAGFQSTLSYMSLRNMQEEIGFIQNKDGKLKCLRPSAISDAVVCPTGHFKRKDEDITNGCENQGFDCMGFQCLCSPCVKAYDVDFAPHEDTQGCSKFAVCGSVEQRSSIDFRAKDNKKRGSGSCYINVIGENGSERLEMARSKGSLDDFHLSFKADNYPVGDLVFEVYVADEQISQSPFRLSIIPRDCVEETDDPLMEPDEFGFCSCRMGSLSFGQSGCVRVATLIGIIFGGSLLLVVCVGSLVLSRRSRQLADQKKLLVERRERQRKRYEGLTDSSDFGTMQESVRFTTGDTEGASGTSYWLERDEMIEIQILASQYTKNAAILRATLYAALLVSGFVTVAFVYLTESETIDLRVSALVIAAAGLMVFLFLVTLFWVYDLAVQKRIAIISENAARANAIVTNMFPGHVRDQVLRLDQKSNPETNESQVKSLTGGSSVSSGSLADLYVESTVLFADIVNFTAWSSTREPNQVLKLLDAVFTAFDDCADHRGIFKVETVGDCYVAVAGVPHPRRDHALAMARFALDIQRNMSILTKHLEVSLGPETADLKLRVGIHSGPVIGGVLCGARARFQLFGDTVNTTQRIESSGQPDKIHVSAEFANKLIMMGRENWLKKRETTVSAKGKGELMTYWLTGKSRQLSVPNERVVSSEDSRHLLHVHDLRGGMSAENFNIGDRTDRLIKWNVDLLSGLIQKMVSHRTASTAHGDYRGKLPLSSASMPLQDVKEIIHLPPYSSQMSSRPEKVEIPTNVVEQLRNYIAKIASMYKKNPFHNFEHASHVVLSVEKMLSRIIAPADILEKEYATVNESLHDHTYGITSDPLTQFAAAFSALIHDVDHRGIGNPDLMVEEPLLGSQYGGRSVAEQNSLDLSWELLMDDDFMVLRAYLFRNEQELKRFRELLINCVLCTDILDNELKAMRNGRWEKAFHSIADENPCDKINRKATIVLEHLIQASDVSHTMQHWHVYTKWNQLLFNELYTAYQAGRSKSNPAEFWVKGEIGFFDFYIIPLAKKLKDCGVFGKSSDEFYHFAKMNRAEWEKKGPDLVARYLQEFHLEK